MVKRLTSLITFQVYFKTREKVFSWREIGYKLLTDYDDNKLTNYFVLYVSRSSKEIKNTRQLLARDIMELRRVYPDIPNSQLRKLIELNKQLYPEMRRR
jgi:hypothetical protein